MTDLMTPKQTDFINLLLRERDVPAAIRTQAASLADKRQASRYISYLLTFPKLVKAAAAAAPASTVPSARDEYFAALAAAEVSKYAVPTKYLANLDMRLNGDLLFFEIRNYKGRRFINRLHGSVGGFSRSRIPMLEATAILALVHNRHVEFAKLFADHHGVCGRCAAKLTDQISRATGFGPECRKLWNL